MPLLKGQVLWQGTLRSGTVEFSEKISGFASSGSPQTSAPYILPGFIDVHVHGGGSADTMDGADGVKTLAAFHVEHGTTSLFPTTITNPWDAILKALKGIKEVIEENSLNLPSILGAHLEGPFISPERLGAQPPNTLVPTAESLETLLSLDVIKLATLAPELPASTLAIEAFSRADVRVSFGHSVASYEETLQALKHSDKPIGFTHLFNAMGGLMGRAPGLVGAAFAHQETYAELILDLEHVHLASFLAAHHAKPDKLVLVTDAIRAAGTSEGESELGGQTVYIQDGRAKLADGTLAGSLLTLDKAFQNAVNSGLSIADASRLVSHNPANYMGLSDRGELAEAKRADIVVLDNDFKVLEVYVAGRKLVG